MCLYPKLIQNRKYIANKKNGGIIPPVYDNRVLAVPVGCGKCIECRKQKAREWQIRLLEDVRHNKNGKFVTLTFSNEAIKELKAVAEEEEPNIRGYELDNKIATIAVKRFLGRWRKKHKKSVRHWLVTELGHTGTEHLHMHGIIWTDMIEEIDDRWQYGYVWTGKKEQNFVNEKTVNYLTKYVNKQDFKHKEYKPKILTSAGIGKGYMDRSDWIKNKYKGKDTQEYYTTRTGHKVAMPIYWRNKVYSDEEREKLWIEKLDKKERWICGEKIDISKGEENYYKTLAYYRDKNKRLGYGDNTEDWNRKKYEQERRQWLIEKRSE